MDAQNAGLVVFLAMHVMRVTGIYHFGCSECRSRSVLCDANYHYYHYYHYFHNREAAGREREEGRESGREGREEGKI